MSSGIVLLIVAIVFVVIIAYLVAIIVRKRNDSLIAKLEERKQELFDLPVNDEIEAVKALHLIGQSQTTFREWNQKWVDLSLNSFSDIENHIFEAENLNDTFNFFRANSQIKNIESQLNLAEEDIKAIREALSILKEQEEKKYPFELRFYESSPLAVTDLLNGRIQAALMDELPANNAIENGRAVKKAGTHGEPDNFGVAMRKGDKDLHKLINDGYKKLMADPYWQELQKKYLSK